MDYKFKCFTYKEFENKREELVNFIFNISSSYSQVQSYSANIAENVAKQKYEVLKDTLRYFDKNNNTFACVLLVEDKPVTYAICNQTTNEDWCIARIVTAMNYQDKGYGYLTERFCINQISLNKGKTVQAYVQENNIPSISLQQAVGFEEIMQLKDLKVFQMNINEE